MSFAAALILLTAPTAAIDEQPKTQATVSVQTSATVLRAERVRFDIPDKSSHDRSSPRKASNGVIYIEFH